MEFSLPDPVGHSVSCWRAAIFRVSATLTADDQPINGFISEAHVQENGFSVLDVLFRFRSGGNEEVGEYLYLYDATWMCQKLSERRPYLSI